jgi:5'-nucleotidase, C-terminal domain
MRVVNDKRYADNAIGVDLILGGHDHIYWIE